MPSSTAAQTTRVALAFEGGLGVAAIAIGWLVGQSPFVGVNWDGDHAHAQVLAIGWGLVATGPLLLALFLGDRFPIGPLRSVREMTAAIVSRMFGGATAGQLMLVAIAAGLGEELLFRGLFQGGLSRLLAEWPGGLVVAIAVASLLFGLCHWLNTTYAILALLAGAYFGLVLVLTGNILAPITAHAAYDFLALVYLIHPEGLLPSED
jgi:membrane protease YdiL (CAAX protease family)